MNRASSTAGWFAVALLALPAAAAGETKAPPAFSHDDWTAVLQRFVDDRGLVDYTGLAQDRAVFDRYLAAVRAVSPRSHPGRFPTRDDALAYYLNAYNAQVFQGVLSRGPEAESVWRGLIPGYGFFVGMDIVVGGETTNLKTLEDEWIREGFRDPRVHAALNCASLGCPRLPRAAFEPARLDEQLDAAMRGFVGEERNCRVDAAARTVTLSKIFDWFRGDFLAYQREQGDGDPALIGYVNRFRAPGERIPGDYRVEFAPYGKGINAR